ncbi:hypothetical protein MTR67_052590 [Solanum verrucosum]|uniref:DUF4283 domain-containing protein n=1 Tax=Solanum verrucosum TaxID=315347 RepID=A0AAF0V766_SOLVR|nr:hypothetical protein MTR67_052590 [Solanum verrucosum]
MMNKVENLQYAIIEKFSYEWPKLEEARTKISKQCNIKGECRIGLLRHRHVLLRFSWMENYHDLKIDVMTLVLSYQTS